MGRWGGSKGLNAGSLRDLDGGFGWGEVCASVGREAGDFGELGWGELAEGVEAGVVVIV
jgi:hypothetical protein